MKKRERKTYGEKKIYAKNSQSAHLIKIVKEAIIVVSIGGFFLLLSIVSSLKLSSLEDEQLKAIMYTNQYRLATKALTSDIQAYAVTGLQKYYASYQQELNEDKNREKALEELKKIDLNEKEWEGLNQISAISDGLVPLEKEAFDAAQWGRIEDAKEFVFGQEYRDTVEQINVLTEETISAILSRKSSQISFLKITQIVFELMFIIAVLYNIFEIVKIIKFTQKELLRPVIKVSDQMGVLAEGDFHTDLDLEKNDSEVGRMVESISVMKRNLSGMIIEISEVLEQMGQGNYDIELNQNYVGEFAQIKESFLKISDSMKDTLSTIQEVSRHIDSGSEQLANAAEDLAEGSTVQAGKVSDLVALINEMSKTMEDNATEAENSVHISSKAGELLSLGNQKMQELKDAIGEISKCSEQIGTIINTIEEIASQTNLLSLNAAIEAARAGEAGRGFAVVAEQVKNLADESARAAGETTKLINTTIQAVHKGIAIADETAENMDEVMQGAKMATERMGQIAEMLKQDVLSMHRIDDNIMKVSQIVDSNSATSEETAAVSEEQKAQVETMVQLLERFEI